MDIWNCARGVFAQKVNAPRVTETQL